MSKILPTALDTYFIEFEFEFNFSNKPITFRIHN